jgi:uncharacterized protein (TIGR00290 family)
MKRKTMLAWSSGKDSAWALHILKQNPEYEVAGLFSTVNEAFNRVAMHAVRLELLMRQAQCAGLPLDIINIPYPCSNNDYEVRMKAFIEKAKDKKIECIAFGDLFLEDVRKYREEKLAGTGITPIFPLWGIPTQTLSKEMIRGGLKAVITCIDPKLIPLKFAGTEYNESFLKQIPESVDPCGENGEFHSFAFAGPMFNGPINISVGEVVHRDGFVFADAMADDLPKGPVAL